MQLRTDVGLVPLTGARELNALNGIDDGRLIILPLKTAQRLFDRGHSMDAVYVTADAGASIPKLQARLRSAVGGWNGVVPSGTPPPETSIASNAIIPMLLVVAVLASGIAAVLVYNIVSLSLEERRKENAILAALGAAPTTIMMGPLAEGAVLGAAGGIVGSAGGWLIAKPVASTLSTFTKTLAGAPVLIHITPATFVAGATIGVGLGVLAAVRPALRAARAGIAGELSRRDRRSASSPLALASRATASLVLTGIALTGCWFGQRHGALHSWQPALAESSFFVTVISVVIATASIAPLIMIGARRLARGGRTLTGLALSNLAREPGRTGVMAIAVAASVGTAFITASFNQSVHAGLSASLSGGGSQGVFVATTARNSSVTVDAKLPAHVIQRLARVPGVATANAQVTILAGHIAGRLVEVEASTRPVMDLQLYAGHESLARFNRGYVLVGPALARRLNLSAGGHLRIDTPHGYAYLPIQGVWADGTLVGENVTVPMSTMTRLWGPQLPAVVAVAPRPGVSPAVLARRIKAAHIYPGLQVLTASQVLRLASSIAAGQLAPFWTLQHALLLVAFVAVLTTLLLVGVERDREMAMLSAIGLSPAGMVRLVISEAAILGLAGAALGVALGFPGVIALNEIAPIFIGFSNPLRFDLATLAIYVPLAIAASVTAAVLPAWRAMRLDVIKAIDYE
jgi:putative ABC transport system permease protein